MMTRKKSTRKLSQPLSILNPRTTKSSIIILSLITISSINLNFISSSSSNNNNNNNNNNNKTYYLSRIQEDETYKNQRSNLLIDPFKNLNRDNDKRPDGCPTCPECFNCQLPRFDCKQFGSCNEYDGQCKCPPGFGGQDCGQPVCGSLADGDKRHVRPENSTSCECKEGWSGVNCNVCESDRSCLALIPGFDSGRNNLLPHQSLNILSDDDGDDGSKGSNKSEAVCYKGGFAVSRNYQMCNVTNRKILEMLPGRPPQVSFTCDVPTSTCQFQFWIGSVESFYCSFEDCNQSIQVGYQGQPNITQQECGKMKCKCIPGKMLCGESGSVDISDFLKEEIKGPGKFSCSSDHKGCKFEEPAMNQLITDIFGDTYITLDCQSGECMHYTMVPGFKVPEKPDNSQMVALSIALTILFVILASGLFWYYGRSHAQKYPAFRNRIRLPTEDDQSLFFDHIPTDLSFYKISYSVPGPKSVLKEISGKAKSGEVMAIMGTSGSGKSSLLDILAKKSKSGLVEGEILINDKQISNDYFKNLIGYVDQEDTLLSTLTVYETVLCSAMLRLPSQMSTESKKIRTLETLEELGILHIKDVFVGKSGRRSISGGEKRRVSIACELVTSPSILFLDEPTSGLDSFNAYNVVEALAGLAKNYKRTVIFTVHQPQSNILALFDQLVLLGNGGRLVYSGAFSECHSYFEKIGYACPSGYNIADFLIDLTMTKKRDSSSSSSASREASTPSLPDESPGNGNQGNGSQAGSSSPSSKRSGGVEETELLIRKTYSHSPRSVRSAQKQRQSSTEGSKIDSLSHRRSNLTTESGEEDLTIVGELNENFLRSEIYTKFSKEFEAARANELLGSDDLNNLIQHLDSRGNSRAGIFEQLFILSGRAFKNMYRNPMLMFSHYLLAIVLAGICAGLFRNVTMDIGGFQGRMGLFFFILALFGFSSLTTITIFNEERLIFMRERSNNYYDPISYFITKVIFDLVPLRIFPPFILGSIIYYPVGLVSSLETFWKFNLVLISFNLVSSSFVMMISLIVEDLGVANLLGSLVMLFNLLFAGLLINRDKLPFGLRWLQDLSFFHSAFEAMLVNEVRYLTLKDHRYGVDIEVPSATILSLFGFRTTAFWWPDMTILFSMFLIFIGLSFFTLVLFVKERR